MKRTIKQRISEYVAVFEPDGESGYTVTIPALPGCISEGDTFEEAQKNIKEAALLYLEVMEKEQSKDFLQRENKIIIAPVQVAF